MKTSEDRRFARKNEEIMMEDIKSIIATLGAQNTDIEVIKNNVGKLEGHASTLNSKVAIQEGRQQATDTAVALNSKAIEVLLKSQDNVKSFWERNWEKLFWLLVVGAWTYLTTNK